MLMAAGHRQDVEESTVSDCCTDGEDPGQSNRKTLPGSHHLDAWLQNPNPCRDGKFLLCHQRFVPFRKLPAFFCDLHPCCEVYLGFHSSKVISVTHMSCCVVCAGLSAQVLRACGDLKQQSLYSLEEFHTYLTHTPDRFIKL